MVDKIKGQTSLEFLAYIVVMLLALSFLTSSVLDRQQNFNDFRETLVAQQIAVSFSSELQQSLYYDDYVAEFETAQNIYGQDFNISVRDEEVVVSWSDSQFRYPLTYEIGPSEEVLVESSDLPVKIKSKDEGFDIDV